jgi:hypothetical protein
LSGGKFAGHVSATTGPPHPVAANEAIAAAIDKSLQLPLGGWFTVSRAW